ncbi:hypothetical protein JZ751_022652 [Albula glossodonta]|uniref:Uncharacterized protein n=1 Tax=Albula glossodonta TaxID=121402 RepID=A0A8T2PM83_9TELE|nr:hypothetical protein JZ751_022652 [Albula glossodonta]
MVGADYMDQGRCHTSSVLAVSAADSEFRSLKSAVVRALLQFGEVRRDGQSTRPSLAFIPHLSTFQNSKHNFLEGGRERERNRDGKRELWLYSPSSTPTLRCKREEYEGGGMATVWKLSSKAQSLLAAHPPTRSMEGSARPCSTPRKA